MTRTPRETYGIWVCQSCGAVDVVRAVPKANPQCHDTYMYNTGWLEENTLRKGDEELAAEDADQDVAEA